MHGHLDIILLPLPPFVSCALSLSLACSFSVNASVCVYGFNYPFQFGLRRPNANGIIWFLARNNRRDTNEIQRLELFQRHKIRAIQRRETQAESECVCERGRGNGSEKKQKRIYSFCDNEILSTVCKCVCKDGIARRPIHACTVWHTRAQRTSMRHIHTNIKHTRAHTHTL